MRCSVMPIFFISYGWQPSDIYIFSSRCNQFKFVDNRNLKQKEFSEKIIAFAKVERKLKLTIAKFKVMHCYNIWRQHFTANHKSSLRFVGNYVNFNQLLERLVAFKSFQETCIIMPLYGLPFKHLLPFISYNLNFLYSFVLQFFFSHSPFLFIRCQHTYTIY